MSENEEQTQKFKELSELLSDENFLLLNEKLSEFNPFEVLKLKNHEIRHSNVLAWLFNPNENHNLGSAFFEQFLYLLANTKENEVIKKIILSFKSESNIDIKVYREYVTEKKERIDLLMECNFGDKSEKKNNFIIYIENKVYAKQRENQLEKYLEDAVKNCSEENIIPVYLTLNENDELKGTCKDKYFWITYADIYEILKTLLMSIETDTKKSQSYYFIECYKKILEELLNMSDETNETEKLAKVVYKKHKKVIDYIMENSASPIAEAGRRFVTDDKDNGLKMLEKTGNSVFFPFSDTVLKETHDGNEKDWRNGTICGYFFSLCNNKEDDLSGTLKLYIEVGPFDITKIEKREKFKNILMSIKNSPFKTKDSKTYSRIYSDTAKIENIENEDEICNVMKELFNKEKTQKAIKVLHDCVKKYKEETNDADDFHRT